MEENTKTKKSKFETWIENKWRPVAAWTYLVLCVFDFIISPIVFSWFQYGIGQNIIQWTPLTLQGSGIVHISFGSIVGITAWGRTIEKMKINVGGDEKKRNPKYGDPYSSGYSGYQHPYEDR